MKEKTTWKRFKEITDYDFTKEVVKKNVGDEARTFNVINQSKPLLSPSRLSKIFTEHIYWNIPKKSLMRPRLMGQLVHKFIELRIITGEVIILNENNLEEYAMGDYSYILENWNKEQINLFISEVNEAVVRIVNYLEVKKIKILQCEKYVCDLDYHGYIDLVGYQLYQEPNGALEGGRRTMIIDIKITTNEEIINSYYAQLSIYRHIYQNTAQCYILFYNRETKEARLEKASWKQLDLTFEAIDRINKIYRHNLKVDD